MNDKWKEKITESISIIIGFGGALFFPIACLWSSSKCSHNEKEVKHEQVINVDSIRNDSIEKAIKDSIRREREDTVPDIVYLDTKGNFHSEKRCIRLYTSEAHALRAVKLNEVIKKGYMCDHCFGEKAEDTIYNMMLKSK